ncbi:N-acetyltransferase-like protein [Chaetomium strumarium]|uniref:N-acetyltransferase-like protein n=1 Tax=Chaetomium strumarium TaxID=1170767 RepID=A0AAJ0GNQ6_9PEZI|nr:N-acetyltransferase-like protein [Chaetomium strumarium]
MIPANELRTWTRQLGDVTYTVSTDPSQIQLDALNDAFASDMVYWAKPIPRKRSSSAWSSRCVSGSEEGSQGHKMVGFGRLITDYVTFAYLTDVYVLAEHQGKGLGKWMMQCLDEVLRSWPNLRRCVLFTRGAAAVRMYGETIGARDVSETSPSLVVLEKRGPDAAMAGGNEKTREQKGDGIALAGEGR